MTSATSEVRVQHLDAGAGSPARIASTPRVGAGWRRHYAWVLMASDLTCALLAVGVAVAVRQQLGEGALAGSPYPLLFAVAIPAWLLTLAASGAYDARVLGVGSDEFKRVANAAVRFGALLGFVTYLGQIVLARSLVVIGLPLAVALGVCARYAARRVLHHARSEGRACERVVVVGSGEHAITLVRQLQRTPHVGLQVLGVCMPGGRREDSLAGVDVPCFGSIGGVRTAVQRCAATTVAVAQSPGITPTVLRRLAWELEDLDVDIVVSPGLTDVAGPRVHVRPVPGLPLLYVEQPKFSGARRIAKGLMDRTVSALLLLLLAPALAAIALLVRIDSPGPALFRQQRVGRDGRRFTLYKFRSMTHDAEEQLSNLVHLNERSEGPLFKVRDDPRVTRVGAVLRRYSIDELPQLFNVLAGHMSLVGPRPPLPKEVARYDGKVNRRLLVKPGLTGLWQVSGRSDLDWEAGLRLDLYYVENWSPALDAMILWKTLFAVLQARGAY